MATVRWQETKTVFKVMHKEILDMFTSASNFQTKLVSVVVEERKTSSLYMFKLLPAILPSPVFVLNFNFQN